MQKIAHSYIRFSSKKQEQGDSTRRQLEGTKGLCQRNGWQLSPHTWQDLGISAWKGSNFHEGALGAFLLAVKAGKVRPGQILIVESLDRISRQAARKALRIIEQIIEAGITVATITPERSYDLAALDDSFALIEMMLIFMRANEEH
jgi:DNA invertase Pin-like site-specific DNA recombinase